MVLDIYEIYIYPHQKQELEIKILRNNGKESHKTGVTRLRGVLLKHPLPPTGSSEYRQLHGAQKSLCFSQMKTHLQNHSISNRHEANLPDLMPAVKSLR